MDRRPDPNNKNRSFVKFETTNERAISIFFGNWFKAKFVRSMIYLGLLEEDIIWHKPPTHALEGAVEIDDYSLPEETDASIPNRKLMRVSRWLNRYADLQENTHAPVLSPTAVPPTELREMATVINPYLVDETLPVTER